MNTKGVSLVEAVVAAFLIATVGVIMAELLHKNTVVLMWNGQTRKAAALADMVFEKYNYLAATQFSTLEQYNQTQVPASSFFSTGSDNQGYDGMSITTVAALPGADGSRQVTVTIAWGAGGPQQTITMTKFLAAGTTQPGGAPVHVYVTDLNGNGVAGFEVRAAHEYNPAYLNSIGTNEVIGYTDNTGYVVLNNVSIDPNYQPMPVYARKPGSDATILKSDPDYVQGYYVSPSNTWNYKYVTVTPTSPNTVYYNMKNNDFTPMASVSGILTATGGGSNTNMQITLVANATDGPSLTIDNQGDWETNTDNTGYYEFNNIAAGPVTVYAQGIEGSYPTVTPDNSSFQQGYVGFGGNGSSPWIYQMTMADPAASFPNVNVKIRPLGSLNLNTVDINGNPLPNANVNFVWPDIGFWDRGNTWSGTTDSNGNLQLYNLFAGDAQQTAFNATVLSTACITNGDYVYNDTVPCSASETNLVNINLKSGSSIQGTLTNNSSPSTPLGGVQISVPALDGSTSQTVTAADGTYALCDISADPTYIPGWPNVTFTLVDQSNRNVAGTFSGTAEDSNFTTVPLPSVNIVPASNLTTTAFVHNVACASDPNPTNAVSDTILTSLAGSYGPICAYMPFQTTVSKTVTGGPSAFTANLAVSTASIKGGLSIQSNFYTPKNKDQTVVDGSTYTGYTLKGTLIAQMVSGVISDAFTGTPLQGINFDLCQVSGCNTSCPITTDGGGNYGPVAVCVTGRSSGNPGNVTVTVPDGVIAQNTGFAYSGNSQSTPIVNPPTPGTAFPFNFSLYRKGGGM